MRKKITLTLVFLLCLFHFRGNAQTQFWSDTFEDAGAPSSGTRTPSIAEFSCGGPPATAYFMRTLPTSIALQNGAYTGFQGSKIWALEDTDKGPTCVNNSINANQQITWSGINIAGKSGLSFKGLFAADNIGGWQGLNFGAAQDFVAFEYSIDGGPWTKGLIFCSNVPASSPASSNTLDLDTNGDMIGDGASLNYTLTEYSANIVGTGTTLSIRMNCFANAATTQEVAIDNFRLFETPVCVPPVISANPPNRSICNNANTTFTCSATGATGFQWQVNTGSGFIDITNGGVYSGATTNTLTITGAVATMNGYLYRCVAYNGVVTCFTNSNSATLTISNIFSSGIVTNVSCNGGSNGVATVTPTGGIAPYTYSWAPSGGTGAVATGLSVGAYTVTITDAIGCTATRNFTITQPPALSLLPASQTNIACFGGSNGAAAVNNATGGSAGYTYNWTPGNPPGDGTTTVTGLTAGVWTCTVTDANGCTATRSFTITQPASAVSGTTVVTNVACFGGNTGAINLTPTGGTGPYTFNWAGGATTEDRTSLTAGTYSVTITDANGCTGTVNATVTQPASSISGTTVVTNVACFGGNTGAINLTPTGGTGPYTFNWAGGATTEDRTSLSAGTYSVTITDANGCTGTVNATVTQPASAVSGTTVVTNVACFGGNTGAINLTPTGGTGPYTFNWAGGATTEDRTSLSAGTYSVTITDANGCTGTVNATLTQPASAVSGTTVVTNVACFGGNTGAINLTPTGGTGPYTFNWAGGATTEDRTSLTAGTYSVTITDANGCTGTVNATVTQPASAVSGTTVVTNVACFGGNTGAINLTPTGGTGPYTFNWVGGITTEDRTNLTAGTYSVTITDANGCTGTVNATVTQPASAVSGTTVVTNVACFGGNTGAINLTPTGGTGPYTFNWAGGATTEDRTSLTAGTYSVTITDANGCTGTVNATVTQPTGISLATNSQTNVSCNGGANGTATVTPTGGVPGYTYSWSPSGGTAATATGLSAGIYTVTVTDANGCTSNQSFTITQPTAISLAANSQTNVSCNGGSNGTATVIPTGGVPAYTYSWSPSGGTAATATGLSAGIYTVTVTDANGCTANRSFTITQPTAISLAANSQTNVSCNGGANGTATVTPTGGVPGYTYSWSPSGGTAATATGLSAGIYTVTVTDANGCTANQSFTITQPTAISLATNSQTNVSCNGGANGTATVTPTGGVPGYTYSWSPSGGTAATATGLSAGIYTVTVTDANGCTANQSFTITQPTAISLATNSQTNVSCNGGSNGTATVNPTGGVPGYTYSWSPAGGTAATATGLSAGIYTVTVTDANGCTANRSFTITQPTAISLATNSQTNVSCNGGSNGTATVTPTGGVPGYTYSWSPSGGTAATATGLSAGIYTVTVTDANGCTANQSFTITEPVAIDTNVTLTSGVLESTQNGATYQWYLCPNTILTGETNQTFTPTIVGDYKVEITLGGCSSTSNCITVTTLTNESFDTTNLTYYPNPTSNVLNISYNNVIEEVQVYNLLGQELFTNKTNNKEIVLNLSTLPSATYFVKITSEGKSKMIKIVKQ